MAPSWFQLVLVVILAVVLFGRGKISDVMGDFAKGIKSFKKGLSDDPDDPVPPKAIDERPADRVDARASSREDLRA